MNDHLAIVEYFPGEALGRPGLHTEDQGIL